MDGGKIKNLIQSGNFESRSVGAGLRWNYGKEWPMLLL
jgi:hypothetical protein